MTHNEFIEILMEILKYTRPSGSQTEKRLLQMLTDEFGFEKQPYGAIRWGKNKDIFLIAHTDTVGIETKTNCILDKKYIYLPQPAITCLGADDGAGIAILTAIAKERDDITLFAPTAEEIGGLGTRYFLETTKHIPYIAISLDRKGTKSVITHQGNIRTCSNQFAETLCKLLNLQPDPTGTFTDSAIFAEYGCPECTNISVGYQYQHTTKEILNHQYLWELTQKIIQIDFLQILKNIKV